MGAEIQDGSLCLEIVDVSAWALENEKLKLKLELELKELRELREPKKINKKPTAMANDRISSVLESEVGLKKLPKFFIMNSEFTGGFRYTCDHCGNLPDFTDSSGHGLREIR